MFFRMREIWVELCMRMIYYFFFGGGWGSSCYSPTAKSTTPLPSCQKNAVHNFFIFFQNINCFISYQIDGGGRETDPEPPELHAQIPSTKHLARLCWKTNIKILKKCFDIFLQKIFCRRRFLDIAEIYNLGSNIFSGFEGKRELITMQHSRWLFLVLFRRRSVSTYRFL